jgi:nitroimidazol reductase NimA-like FMN-containing flavoprotein (pyridoxamine 5'-phosphate oxidase superfamily)
MRRQDKEIVDVGAKLEIISRCKVCRLGLSDNNTPYIVPLNYGYSFENNILTLFFHGAHEGKKMDIIRNNNRACFEIDCEGKLIEAEKACGHSYAYKSIIGFGKIILIKSPEEMADGLNKFMRHQTGIDRTYNFDEAQLKNVTVYKLVVDEFTGKHKEFPAK